MDQPWRETARAGATADFLPSNSVSSMCVCVCSIFVRYCAHFRGLQQLCKAVSVDIASMEERFLHSLRYTLINLLKPARPVSSTLTHQEKKRKSQAAQNPTRIFSMDASGKSLQPTQLTVLCQSVQKCI